MAAASPYQAVVVTIF